MRAHGWPEVAKALWDDHFWSPSYCVVSCAGAPLETVKAYGPACPEPAESPDRNPGGQKAARSPIPYGRGLRAGLVIGLLQELQSATILPWRLPALLQP